jgi:CrcB protein
MLKSLLMVGLGGFVGSVLRYLISYYVNINWSTHFPFGTLLVNLAGSFFIGMIIAAALQNDMSQQMRLLLATGFCGGFTTFSSFSYEFFSLIQNQHLGYAFLYAGTSLVFGLLFVWLGMLLIKG